MSAALKLPFEIHRETFRQGNWKREGAATRHEIELAIARLLERGKIVVDSERMLSIAGEDRQRGDLRMRLALSHVAKDRRELWKAKDLALEAYCHRIECHETRSRKSLEGSTESGSLWQATLTSPPRRSVAKYVLRELEQNGPSGYEALVTTINECGGLEWILEAPRKVKLERRRGRR